MKPKLLFVLLLCLLACPQTAAPQMPGTQPQFAVDSSTAALAHARQLMQEGKYDEAIAELQRLSSAQPSIRGVAHELGMAFYRKSDYSRAIEFFKQATQQDPSDREATGRAGRRAG